VSNNIDNFFEDDYDMNIEYLKINIEDSGEVEIKMSFPVAFNFIENAFNECSLKRSKSTRNCAFVDDDLMTP